MGSSSRAAPYAEALDCHSQAVHYVFSERKSDTRPLIRMEDPSRWIIIARDDRHTSLSVSFEFVIAIVRIAGDLAAVYFI